MVLVLSVLVGHADVEPLEAPGGRLVGLQGHVCVGRGRNSERRNGDDGHQGLLHLFSPSQVERNKRGQAPFVARRAALRERAAHQPSAGAAARAGPMRGSDLRRRAPGGGTGVGEAVVPGCAPARPRQG